MKRFLSATLALLLLALSSVPAMAYGNTASTDVYMAQVSDDIVQISVTVPLKVTLKLDFDEDFGMYMAHSPEGYGVTNNSPRTVSLQSISMSMEEGYSLVRADNRDDENLTTKQLIVFFDNGSTGNCQTEAAAGAQDVVVSELPNSGFSSEEWRIDPADEGNYYKPINIHARLPGGLDPTWFEGETKLFTVSYTFVLGVPHEEVI